MSDKIEINVMVNGETVPLSAISVETFEKIRKAENRKNMVYIGDIFEDSGGSEWMFIYCYRVGAHFVCVTKNSDFYGRTYSNRPIAGEIDKFKKGILRYDINKHFFYTKSWKLIERTKDE